MSSYIINTWRNPYGEGFSCTRPRKIEIKSGITMLVGCNGAGKSTLLRNIKEQLNEENIPCLYFNNLGALEDYKRKSIFNCNYDLISSALSSSEGENITLTLGTVAPEIKYFIDNGIYKDKRDRLANIINNSKKEDNIITSKDRWILLDAIDSGYSIDNVIELKEDLLQFILEDGNSQGLNVYIVASCNQYEMTIGVNNFDVMNGKYIEFKDYNDFKKFILHTKEKKRKRYKN